MEAPTGMVLDSRDSNFLNMEITLQFVPHYEYPFLVTDSDTRLWCISYREALEKFIHFYAFTEREVA